MSAIGGKADIARSGSADAHLRLHGIILTTGLVVEVWQRLKPCQCISIYYPAIFPHASEKALPRSTEGTIAPSVAPFIRFTVPALKYPLETVINHAPARIKVPLKRF
jgi:hypothetical protein